MNIVKSAATCAAVTFVVVIFAGRHTSAQATLLDIAHLVGWYPH